MPRWKALPDELDPDILAFTERLRRLVDRSGLGVVAVAERTGHERSAWDTYLNARLPVPRSAVVALAEATGSDIGSLAAAWERAERAWSRTARRTAPVPAETAPAPVPVPAETAPAPATVPAKTASASVPATVPAEPTTPPGDDRTMEIRRLDRIPGPTPVPPRAPAAAAPTPAAPSSGTSPSPAAAPFPAAAPPAPARRPPVLLYAAGVVGALLVVTAALLLVDLGGADDGGGPTAAPPATTAPTTAPKALPAGVKCAGADCSGHDPEAMGCGGELAATVARARVGTALVEVRHSATCSAVWARISGAKPGDTVTVEVAGAVERAVPVEGADTDAYTPMLAVTAATDARACGTLADGRVGCTANP
ncbi:DUF2690 domain-containing protein [Streptomyces sp. NPDC055055]